MSGILTKRELVREEESNIEQKKWLSKTPQAAGGADDSTGNTGSAGMCCLHGLSEQRELSDRTAQNTGGYGTESNRFCKK